MKELGYSERGNDLGMADHCVYLILSGVAIEIEITGVFAVYSDIPSFFFLLSNYVALCLRLVTR